MRHTTDAKTFVTTICAGGVLLVHKATFLDKQIPFQHTTHKSVSIALTATSRSRLKKGTGAATERATMTCATIVSHVNENDTEGI